MGLFFFNLYVERIDFEMQSRRTDINVLYTRVRKYRNEFENIQMFSTPIRVYYSDQFQQR